MMKCRVCARDCYGDQFWYGSIITRLLADPLVPRDADGALLLCYACQRGVMRWNGLLPFLRMYLQYLAVISGAKLTGRGVAGAAMSSARAFANWFFAERTSRLADALLREKAEANDVLAKAGSE